MQKKGFTLIEVVMVIVIIGILAAVAIPTFFNLQDEAKKAATKGGLGGLRSGIAIWYAMKATSGIASWPSFAELTQKTPGGVLTNGVPPNPLVPDVDSRVRVLSGVIADADNTAYGWIYSPSTGEIWATSGDGTASAY